MNISQQLIVSRYRVYHRIIAKKMKQDEKLFSTYFVDSMMSDTLEHPLVERWQSQALCLSLNEFISWMLSTGSQAHDLRLKSPFLHLVDPQEKWIVDKCTTQTIFNRHFSGHEIFDVHACVCHFVDIELKRHHRQFSLVLDLDLDAPH